MAFRYRGGEHTMCRVRGRPAPTRTAGAAKIGGPNGRYLFLFFSTDGEWEHVSVSVVSSPHETPAWSEMCHAKGLCWDNNNVVMQLHPRGDCYINVHPGVLHMWRPVRATIPTPPVELV